MQRRMCKFLDCKQGVDYKQTDYCRTHHKQFIEGKELKPIKEKGTGRSVCNVLDCNRFVSSNELCRPHVLQRERGLKLTAIKFINKKGDGCILPTGYKAITIDGERVLEHRFIMEKFLQRKLIDKETVHHKNGNRLDNRIENLELWSSNQPGGQRVIDKIKWAQEILEQYKDELDLILNKSVCKNNK